MRFLSTVLLLFSALLINTLFAQQHVRVQMKDGRVLSGKLLTQTEEEFIMDTPDRGKLNLSLLDIQEIRELATPEWIFPNIARHQTFVGPTAFGLPKGSIQYANTMLFFHQFGYGFNDNFSLFGGTEFVSLLGSLSAGEFAGPGFYLRPHVTKAIQADKLAFGAGVLTYGALGTDFSLLAASPYLSLSLGSADRNVSSNIGFAFGSDIDPALVFAIAANYRISNKFGLMTENWFFPADFSSSGIVSSLGCRFYGKRTAWHLALTSIIFDFDLDIIPFPYFGVTYNIK
jgi:hypothetical protein